MTIFIELTVESFAPTAFSRGPARAGAGSNSVRRPLRGIEVKDDTHAVIRVIDATGKQIPLVSSSYPGGSGPDYTNFLLQSVQDPREEKTQILETFGETYVFFYGERHRMVSVSALLINTLDFNWKAEFEENYDKYLRGTKCVESGARVYLYYDDNIVEGFIMRATVQEEAVGNPYVVPLQFLMFVTKHTNISYLESSEYPIRPQAAGVSDSMFTVSGLVDPTTDVRSLPEWLSVDRDYKDKFGNPVENQSYKPGGPDKIKGISGDTIDPTRPATSSVNRKFPLRSKITDNYDEWTGDRFAPAFDLDRLINENTLELQRLQDEFIKRACSLGANANSASALGKMGLFGPGDNNGMSTLKGAWNALKDPQKLAGDLYSAAKGAFASVGVQGSWNANVDLGKSGQYRGSNWEAGHGGSGSGYFAGGGVGYNAKVGGFVGTSGGSGYYAGAGYKDQYGSYSPGFGSGGASANLSAFGSSGAWAGWSSEEGFSSGKGTPPWEIDSGNNSGVAGWRGVAGGSPSNAAVGQFASVGGSWDPDNGFQWRGFNGNPSAPMPGEPGGGVFTVQAFGRTSSTPVQGPYGQFKPSDCKNLNKTREISPES